MIELKFMCNLHGNAYDNYENQLYFADKSYEDLRLSADRSSAVKMYIYGSKIKIEQDSRILSEITLSGLETYKSLGNFISIILALQSTKENENTKVSIYDGKMLIQLNNIEIKIEVTDVEVTDKDYTEDKINYILITIFKNKEEIKRYLGDTGIQKFKSFCNLLIRLYKSQKENK